MRHLRTYEPGSYRRLDDDSEPREGLEMIGRSEHQAIRKADEVDARQVREPVRWIRTFESFTKVMEEAVFGRNSGQFNADKLFPKTQQFTNRRRSKNPTNLAPAEEYNVFVHAFRNDPNNIIKFLEEKIGGELRLIGNGFMGLAFKWDSGARDKVIKLTIDKTEYRAALKLSKNPVKGVARYHWAKAVELPHKLRSRRFGKHAYVICMDKLKQMDSDDQDALIIPYFLRDRGYLDPASTETENLRKLRDFLLWLAYEETETYQPFVDMRMSVDAWMFPGGKWGNTLTPTRDVLLGCLYGLERSEDTTSKLERIGMGRIEKLATQYLSIIKSCKDNGIPPDDIHLGNMAFDKKGALVAFDCMGKMSG